MKDKPVGFNYAIIILMLNASALIFCLLILLELGIWSLSSSTRRVVAAGVAAELVPITAWFVLTYFTWYALPLLFIVAYRLFNLLRVVARRRQPDHMYRVTRQASLWLALVQTVTVALAITAPRLTPASLTIIASVILIGVIILATSTQRNLKTTRPKPVTALADQADLPTVSVLIPARNETNDLNECLESLVRSAYPKLEIIVLDDCSQNKRTPEIIKGFAHAGVRFIAGSATPSAWLAKNHACQQLVTAASSDLLLFCGVDTRFKPGTIEQMVLSLLQKQKTMVSFIPANIAPRAATFASLLVQPSRYAWEVALPRRSLDRPPVLSSAWLIQRQTLVSAGNFAAFSRAITPERYLARYAAAHNDGYSFEQSDTLEGVASAKSFQAQRATAIRTRYPQLHQSLELTALTSFVELAVLVVPFILLIVAIVNQQWLLGGLAVTACLLLISMYTQIVNLTYRRFLVRGLWLLPVAAIYDVLLLNYSMYKYEFSIVQWKGRNVCIPVMQVIERLPKV